MLLATGGVTGVSILLGIFDNLLSEVDANADVVVILKMKTRWKLKAKRKLQYVG